MKFSRLSRPRGHVVDVGLPGLALFMIAAAEIGLGSGFHGESAAVSGRTIVQRRPVAAQPVAPPSSTEMTFATHCATCHGATGMGDGPASYLLFPKPRDFTSGVFRFKSTYNQDPPTRADLERTIRNGIARTAMPAFTGVLTDEQTSSLIDYVLSLNARGWGNEPVEPITIPATPPFSNDLIEQGRLVFLKMGCVPCHGETGRGDGPSAGDLRDSVGYPLPPADFTTGVFKSGRGSEDLYRTILVGVPGTPMPSFQSSIDAKIQVEGVDPDTNQVWAMVAYMTSLIEPHEHEGIPSGATLAPKRTTESSLSRMMTDPFDAGWNNAAATAVSLQPLWQRRHATRAVDIRVVQTDRRIAFCLEWVDGTVDGSETLSTATDASGIMFSLKPEVPTLTMGLRQENAETLVNIWQWKASRQIDADAGQRRDIEALRAGQPVDMYPFKNGDPVAGALTEHDPTYITAWGAGNPQSDPALMNRPVLCMNAAGFGTLTIADAQDQNIDGVGRWRDGVWRTVFVRELPAHHEGDVDFKTISRLPLAFAIWDGAALDRNGTKLISGWHWLEIAR